MIYSVITLRPFIQFVSNDKTNIFTVIKERERAGNRDMLLFLLAGLPSADASESAAGAASSVAGAAAAIIEC